MLSIVGIFRCAKVLVFFRGMMKFRGIFRGMPKFVGVLWGLKSGLRQSPCSRQKSEYSVEFTPTIATAESDSMGWCIFARPAVKASGKLVQ